jgi:hypothetical protein
MTKVPQAEVLPFNESEIKAQLKACESTPESRQAFSMKRPIYSRDRAITLLLLDTIIFCISSTSTQERNMGCVVFN